MLIKIADTSFKFLILLSFLLVDFTGSKNLLVSFKVSKYFKHLLLVIGKLKSYPKFVFLTLKSRTFLYLKSDPHLSKS